VRWRTGVHLNQQVDFVVGERLIGPAAEIEDAAESIPAAKRDRTRRAKTQVKTFPADRGRKTLEIGPGGVVGKYRTPVWINRQSCRWFRGTHALRV
jgi:hypothetical protein